MFRLKPTNLLWGALIIASFLRTVSVHADDNLYCRVVAMDVQFEDDSPETVHNYDDGVFYECAPIPHPYGRVDFSYDLDLPKDFIDANPDLPFGDTIIAIPNGTIVQGDLGSPSHVDYPPDAKITLVDPKDDRLGGHRHLARGLPGAVVGTRTVLIVRIHPLDDRQQASADEMRGAIFGIGPQAKSINTRSQLSACSWGKLKFEPAVGPNITGGLLEYDYAGNITTGPVEDYRDDILEDLRARFDPKARSIGDVFHHILLCFPPGVRTRKNGGNGFIAYAELNHFLTVYRGTCTRMDIVTHEWGHNVGLWHSGTPGRGYGDLTGYMGSSTGPVRKCFNANKLWQLGWYHQSNVELSGQRAWTGRMIPFVDYNRRRSNHVVVVKIKNYYINWNLAIRPGINEGTGSFHSQVVAVKKNRADDRPSASTAVASFWPNPWGDQPSFKINNFDGTNHTLIVQQCGYRSYEFLRDEIILSIHLDNGIQKSYCNGGVQPFEYPTTSPSNYPETPYPTFTKAPTSTPSSIPTTSPSTPFPSASPTTFSPSTSPSLSLSPSDSPSTSLSPSASPSTPFPSATPSISDSPTSSPTFVCEDREGFVDNGLTCLFMAVNPNLRRQYCVPGTIAWEKCIDSCERCHDGCNDRKGHFYVDSNFKERTCSWLHLRPDYQGRLCRPGHPAFELCQETCNTCENDWYWTAGAVTAPEPSDAPTGVHAPSYSSMPSIAPSTSSPTEAPSTATPSSRPSEMPMCEDSTGTFHVATARRSIGQRNCAWLSRNRAWQQLLCRPEHDAYHMCPELCGQCSDSCHDNPSFEFYLSSLRARRSCEWLSIRPDIAKRFCRKDDVARACKETCDTCTAEENRISD